MVGVYNLQLKTYLLGKWWFDIRKVGRSLLRNDDAAGRLVLCKLGDFVAEMQICVQDVCAGAPNSAIGGLTQKE